MPKPGMMIELKGDIGELDYGGITLNALDGLTQSVATDVVVPEVKRQINRITGETERSVKVKRLGFFNPNGTTQPAYRVYTEIEHGQILEYGYGGRNAFMRPAARNRRTKAGIRALIKKAFGAEWTGQARIRRRRKS